MIRKYWPVLLLMSLAAWYVIHKNCEGCQRRMTAARSRFIGGGAVTH